MNGPYDDIINLPHHVSTTHPRMSATARAAQFAPFAALTGHSAAISETARLTERKTELDEHAKSVLDMKQRILSEVIDECPEITITYFRPDARKSGGEYLTVTGKLKKINEHERSLTLVDAEPVPIDDIIDLESELFYGMF